MSSLNLDCLNNELFELVVSYLSIDDIRSLRLVDKLTAHKATQNTFRSFFRSKHVDLTRQSLEALVRMTSQENLGNLVENLSLVSIVYNPLALERIVMTGEKYVHQDDQDAQSRRVRKPCSNAEIKQATVDLSALKQRQSEDEELRVTGTDVALLTEAFANLTANNKKGLKTLSLQVAVYRHDPYTKLLPREGQCWKWVFTAASRTFILAMSCLRSSRVPLQVLDIFAKKPASLSCNLPCDALDCVAFRDVLPLATIKVLSIGISDLMIYESEHDIQNSGDREQRLPFTLHDQKFDFGSLQAQIAEESNYNGLSKIVERCQNLEHLDISGYYLPCSNNDLLRLRENMRLRYLHYLAHIEPLRRLRKLRLAGFAIDSSDLVMFLTAHSCPLRHVELSNIGIDAGSWAPIMLYLSSENMNLDTIYLEDLFEAKKLIHFAGEQEQNCTQIYGDYGGRNIIRCWGIDAKKTISSYPYQGKVIGSARVWKWTLRWREEFGGR